MASQVQAQNLQQMMLVAEKWWCGTWIEENLQPMALHYDSPPPPETSTLEERKAAEHGGGAALTPQDLLSTFDSSFVCMELLLQLQKWKSKVEDLLQEHNAAIKIELQS